MKFLLFSDLHNAPGVFMGGTLEDLAELKRRCTEENCAFAIHAGDFCHSPHKSAAFLAAYHSFPVPAYHCLGNHDADGTPYEQVLPLYRMEKDYYFFDADGLRIVVLNANYLLRNGNYVNYSLFNYYKHPDCRDYLPPEQLRWLEETLFSSPHPCILLCHESFERPDGVRNREEVLSLIRRANERRPCTVIACFNGHYHRDHHRLIDGVLFCEINSASYDWLPEAHQCYPKELEEQHELVNHTIVYDRPLSAVVTWEDRRLCIDGTQGDYLFGISWQETGNSPLDGAGRALSPCIRSFCVDYSTGKGILVP